MVVWISAGALVISTVVLIVGGGPFTRLADRLADRTGLGETMAGIILVGAVTSLPGLITSVLGAARGAPDFAVSNAMGGIAIQTTFIVIADLAYRRANLEHAAASLPNLLAPIGLSVMFGVVLFAAAGPQVTVLGVHPASAVLLLVYWYWLRLSREVGANPLWRVERTSNTRIDDPDPAATEGQESLHSMWLKFTGLATLVAGTGYVIGEAGLTLAAQTGLSNSFVGAVVTGVITSMPELVTVLYAVRIGALSLAIGDIVGGNGFDMLFITASDVTYREGSIYGVVGQQIMLLIGLAVVLNLLLAAGLVRRQERGIGFEGVAVLAGYLVGVVTLYAIS